eukprot:Tbor_TRINITY_DN5920_c0_g1::TRINITY_DN5920_c0_g1_i1::g.19243::m.19243
MYSSGYPQPPLQQQHYANYTQPSVGYTHAQQSTGVYGMPPFPQQGSQPMPYPIPQPYVQQYDKDHQELVMWFQAVDQDRSGRISGEELQAALSNSGRTFNRSTVDKMIRLFDSNNSGFIDFNEFTNLHKFIKDMTAAFKARDISGDGLLDGNEVRIALGSSGYQFSEGTIQMMMKRFDRRIIGGLSLDDYIDCAVTLAMCRNTFAAHDITRTGQVTMNFDTFCSSVLSVI